MPTSGVLGRAQRQRDNEKPEADDKTLGLRVGDQIENWAVTGIDYPTLLTTLIETALARGTGLR